MKDRNSISTQEFLESLCIDREPPHLLIEHTKEWHAWKVADYAATFVTAINLGVSERVLEMNLRGIQIHLDGMRSALTLRQERES